MKKILERLGLPETATEDQAAEAIAALQAAAAPKPQSNAEKLEKRIRAKMTESGGALNYEQAKIAIEHQDAATASAKPKAKK